MDRVIVSILVGVVAAGVVYLSRFICSKSEPVTELAPFFICATVGLVALLQKWAHRDSNELGVKRGLEYGTLADLYLSGYPSEVSGSEVSGGSALDGLIRGVLSFLLTCLGGIVGPEGVAIEWGQSIQMKLRSHYSRWVPAQRRSDIGSSLAAGISAAFGAPFGAVLFAVELGIEDGILASVVSSLSAFLGTQFLFEWGSVESFDVKAIMSGFKFGTWHFGMQGVSGVLGVSVIGALSGVAAAGLIHLIRYVQSQSLYLFSRPGSNLKQNFSPSWIKLTCGALLISLIFWIGRAYPINSSTILEEVLWLRHPPQEVLFLFAIQLVLLLVILSSFGTLGIIWPLFAIGGLLGFCINSWLVRDFVQSASAVAGLMGSAAFCGAFLGVPVAATVMIYEMTQNTQVILPCLLAAFVAHQCRHRLCGRTWFQVELGSRGAFFGSGYALNVLDSVTVKDAMTRDFTTVFHQETWASLKQKMLESQIPFLPVVGAHGGYLGMISREFMLSQGKLDPPVLGSISQFLEVKDLLYGRVSENSTIRVGDRLSDVVDLVAKNPCLPVLDEAQNVVGLLFEYGVKFAYEREVSRRSYRFVRDSDN